MSVADDMPVLASARTPYEVWEHILGMLDERSALRACGLTCRAFVYPAQTRLFRQTQIKVKGCEGFLGILTSAPHIGLCVRELVVTGEGPWFPTRPASTTAGDPFVAILRHLPRLQRLSLLSVLRRSISLEFLAALPTLFPVLTALHIYHSELHPADVVRLASACPRLAELRFEAGYGGGEDVLPGLVPLSVGTSCIRHVSWHSTTGHSHALALLAPPLAVRPVSLSVHILSALHSGAQDIVSAAAATLEHLTLNVLMARFSMGDPSLDFSECTALQSLCVKGCVLPDVGVLPLVLSRVQDSHSSLRRLYLSLGITNHPLKTIHVPWDTQWAELDRQLTRILRLPSASSSPLVVTFYLMTAHLPPTQRVLALKELPTVLQANLKEFLEAGGRIRFLWMIWTNPSECMQPFFSPPSSLLFDNQPDGPHIPEVNPFA